MSRDKQISEMVKICCNTCEFGCGFNGECDLGNDYRTCGVSKETAEALYNAGYRKSTDIAEEIFAEIEQVMSSLDRRYMASGNPKQSWGVRGAMTKIAELKKKYTKEITEEGK